MNIRNVRIGLDGRHCRERQRACSPPVVSAAGAGTPAAGAGTAITVGRT